MSTIRGRRCEGPRLPSFTQHAPVWALIYRCLYLGDGAAGNRTPDFWVQAKCVPSSTTAPFSASSDGNRTRKRRSRSPRPVSSGLPHLGRTCLPFHHTIRRVGVTGIEPARYPGSKPDDAPCVHTPRFSEPPVYVAPAGCQVCSVTAPFCTVDVTLSRLRGLADSSTIGTR